MTIEEFIIELNKINIFPCPKQLEQLEKYYLLLVEWNQKMNLTGITEKSQVYLKHFFDSATLVKAIDLNEQETLCDIGSGAGFPGMVLKILFPNLKVTLVDSLTKRILFLNQVIKELELKDIETVLMRAEELALQYREYFDIVTARAVASLPILLEICLPLIKVNKYFVTLKGNRSDEIKISHLALQKLSGIHSHTIVFKLPKEESDRMIPVFTKKEKTNLKYPRKYSEIKKKPFITNLK